MRVTEVVRTDSQSQTLDSFLERPSGTGGSAPAAAASFMAVPRKRKAAEQALLGVRADVAEQERACAALDEFPAHPLSCPRSSSNAVAALKAEVEGRTDQGTAFGFLLFEVPCSPRVSAIG